MTEKIVNEYVHLEHFAGVQRERNEWIVITLVIAVIAIAGVVMAYKNQRTVEVAVESGVLKYGGELYTLIPAKFEPGLKVEYIKDESGQIVGRRLVKK